MEALDCAALAVRGADAARALGRGLCRTCVQSLDLDWTEAADDAASDSGSSASGSAAGDRAAPPRTEKKRGKPQRPSMRHRAARATAVLVIVLAGASMRRALVFDLPSLRETLADVRSARDQADELVVLGQVSSAIDILEETSKKWAALERSTCQAIFARTGAVGVDAALATRLSTQAEDDSSELESDGNDDDRSPEALAIIFEDAQHAVAHARATLGSLVLESGDARRAVNVLTATCPTLWFFGRRASLGDEHVRGEVSWLRCYTDLAAAHRLRGEGNQAALIERDVVAHSTPWLRARRDAAKGDGGKKALRRDSERAARWPRTPPRLRVRLARAPRAEARRQRNARKMQTLAWLSKVSALTAAERAVTARDFGRAKAKGRWIRRELNAVARAYADAADAHQKSRLVALLRETAAAATADLALEEDDHREFFHSVGGGHVHNPYTYTLRTHADGAVEPAAAAKWVAESAAVGPTVAASDASLEPGDSTRWTAGLALAAMLRSSQQLLRETVQAASDENTTDAGLALIDDLLLEDGGEFPLMFEDSKLDEKKRATPPFIGRAFAQHPVIEAAHFVSIVSAVHTHGWAWLRHEAARLEEEQRRFSLAIAPLAGPPPGFLGRYDVLRAVAQLRAAALHRQELQQQLRDAAGDNDANRRRRSEPKAERASFAGPSIAALACLVLSAARSGSQMLKGQGAKGDSQRRRPKRSAREAVSDAAAHFIAAVRCCAACWIAAAAKGKPSWRQAKARGQRWVRRLLAAAGVSLKQGETRGGAKKARAAKAPLGDASDEAADGAEQRSSSSQGDSDDDASTAPDSAAAEESLEESAAAREDKAVPSSPRGSDELPLEGDEDRRRSSSDCDEDLWQPVLKGGRVSSPKTARVQPRAFEAAPRPASREGGFDRAAASLDAAPDRAARAVPAPARRSSFSSVDEDFPRAAAVAKRGRPAPPPPLPAPAPPKARRTPTDSPRNGAGKAAQMRAAPRMPVITPTSAGEETLSRDAAPEGPARRTKNAWSGAPASAAVQGAARPEDSALEDAIRVQVEYYFSVQNLVSDVYLRTQCMDARGFVPLEAICAFKRLQALAADVALVGAAVATSDKLQVEVIDGRIHVRTADRPERWVMDDSPGRSRTPSPPPLP
ncbi:hypothetical protein M885DRAFT_512041 [Pelagophyceae sp. CCMP2097]|nr:hypothetical protein M885DRAFT_512041 [Pelagophyceae sp. CCMP2097]